MLAGILRAQTGVNAGDKESHIRRLLEADIRDLGGNLSDRRSKRGAG